MSGPRLSVVLSPGETVERLRLSVESALISGERSGERFEIVVALANADGPSREVAQALDHPAVRLAAGSAADTCGAASIAWGEAVILLRGGDLISSDYVARMATVVDTGAMARPSAYLTYGGVPGLRLQESLHDGPEEQARLVFAPPFAPPLAARRDQLLQLSPRAWTLKADWAWTWDNLAAGVRHVVARDAVYAAWSPAVVAPVLLPALETMPQAAGIIELASDADTLDLLYRRGTLARVTALEADLYARDARITEAAGVEADLEAQLASALAQAEEAKAALKAVRASTSWKATAPLRALASLARLGPGR